MNQFSRIAMTSLPSREPLDVRHEAERILLRIVDALIREDYPGLGERAIVAAAPVFPWKGAIDGDATLECRFGERGTLTIPVKRTRFLQDWRCASLPLCWMTRTGVRRVARFVDLYDILRPDLDDGARAGLDALAEEYRVAVTHGVHASTIDVTAQEASPPIADALPAWHRRMLVADRLGAFVDHPFYPTARAKFGMDVENLRRFSPEAMRGFRLRWIALPQEGFTIQGVLPSAWPTFEAVGLSPALARSHALLPVHPFQWSSRLDRALMDAGLVGTAHPAPVPAWDVLPTLSVRTLAVVNAPDLHIKLPLEIATLGRLNLRGIKPGSIRDGAIVQALLADVAAIDPEIGTSLMLVDETTGGNHSNHRFLGYVVRRYPTGLDEDDAVSVAAFGARLADGRTLLQRLIDRHFGGDMLAFMDTFFGLLLDIHLTLWARYGIALEANQQNSVILFGRSRRLRLLLKDNDAPRIDRAILAARDPVLASKLDGLSDPRLAAATPDALAQLFVTITVQLNLGYTVELVAAAAGTDPAHGHRRLAGAIANTLDRLARDGTGVAALRRALLEAPRQPVKYLLRAATLEGKAATGAVDVNKFYGESGPNFLRDAAS